jgi:fumarate reductase flavoprotein subunit
MSKKNKRPNISRREFIRGTATSVGAAALVGFGATKAQSAAAARANSKKWDQETDVVIVGSGAAGLAAAVEAGDHKAKVIVLEKMANIGGCSRVSGGNYGSPNTSVQQKAAAKDPKRFGGDSPDLYYKEKLLLGGYLNDPALVRVFADQALEGYNALGHRG